MRLKESHKEQLLTIVNDAVATNLRLVLKSPAEQHIAKLKNMIETRQKELWPEHFTEHLMKIGLLDTDELTRWLYQSHSTGVTYTFEETVTTISGSYTSRRIAIDNEIREAETAAKEELATLAKPLETLLSKTRSRIKGAKSLNDLSADPGLRKLIPAEFFAEAEALKKAAAEKRRAARKEKLRQQVLHELAQQPEEEKTDINEHADELANVLATHKLMEKI